MKKFFRNLLRKTIKFIVKLPFYGFIFSILFTILYRFLPVPFTPLMGIRAIEQTFEKNREVRINKDWVPLEEISPNLYKAVMCSEDQNFFEHFGFDFEAIQKAQEYNELMEEKGKNGRRGASTISQQTAKNVFLWPSRSWLRKGLEVYFTGLIELGWSKKRIMEVYLNIIEFGDGIYGAEAAAQYFFHKPAKDLTANEAAILAACLPNPLKYNAKNPSQKVLKRKNWILNQMKNYPNDIFKEKQ